MAIVEREKRVALLANVIDLIFAADYRILNTEVVVKTESLLAVGTDCSASVDELDTIFDGFRASSSFEVVAWIRGKSTTSAVEAGSKAVFL